MKKLKSFRWLLLGVIILLMVCILQSFTYTTSILSSQVDVREVNVSGHKYVIASSTAGIAIVHSESCLARH